MIVNDLEDKIMSVWRTCEDIDTFLYRYLDSPAGVMSEDDISNTLLGIKTLHDQRCQKLWDAFEEVLKSNAEERHRSNGTFNESGSVAKPIEGFDYTARWPKDLKNASLSASSPEV